MKRAFVLVAFLLLLCTTAWAQGAGSAPVADPRAAGGKCLLPDLSGLTPAQRAAVALNAGLQMTYVDTVPYPACPVAFACNSITGCGAGTTCDVAAIGRCCHDGSAVLCCQGGGEIVVTQCPCKCVFGAVCSTACAAHTNVSVGCLLVPTN